MSEHDQPTASPRPTTRQTGWLQEKLGYRTYPLTEGYRPRPRKDGSSSEPPGDPPNQGPVGRKSPR